MINVKFHQLFRKIYPATVIEHHSYQNIYPVVSYLDLPCRTSRNYLPFQESKAVMLSLMDFTLFILCSEVLRHLDIFCSVHMCSGCRQRVAHSESRSTLALLVSCSSTWRIWPCNSYGSCHVIHSCSILFHTVSIPVQIEREEKYSIFFFFYHSVLPHCIFCLEISCQHGILWFPCDILVHDR